MYRQSICWMISLWLLGLAGSASADLVGHWWLDEGAGTTAYDSSGNGSDGTLMGDPQWAEQGLAFDGVDDWVDIGNPDQLPDGASPRSICAWAMTQSLASGWRVVVAYGSPAGSQANGFAQNGTLLSGFGYGNDLTMDGFFEIGVWYHLCLTYDGATAIVYVNGEELMSQAKDWSLVRGFTRIGRQVNNAPEFWNGGIADVRIYDHVLTVAEIQEAMLGTPELSANPSPEDEAIDVPRDVVLAWAPGKFADTHDVYFGASWDDVNDASRANPFDVLVNQGQDANTFDPEGVLEFGRIYYWRVDEVNAAPDNTVFKGSVWSFTVEPFAYPIVNVTASSNVESAPGVGPENTVNGSGLNENDEHSTESGDMWQVRPAADESLSIEFEFDSVYKLHQMLVWNYNVAFELLLGFGLKDVTVEYSQNGDDWAVLGDVAFNQATTYTDYTANTTVDFEGVAAQYVRLTVNSGYGTTGQFGLSEVRFLSVPIRVREPEPADGAIDVIVDADLSWRAGREAVWHDVYLGSDPNALERIDTTGATTFDPGSLDLGVTYYWKIDEVNEAEAVSTWEGVLWSFSAEPYLVVEDFEAYNDDDNLIYETWLDGWVNGTGSTVGYLESPFAEQTIIHGGSQSMPLFYDNTQSATSEAEFSFTAQDWTANGVQSLSLYFRGAEGNGGQLYIKINNTKVPYDGDGTDIARTMWQPWNIDLSAVGAGMANVTKLTIGIEDAGAKGVVYIDDIRLYPNAVEYLTPTEPDTAGLLAHHALDGDASDGSGNGYDGVENGEPTYGAGVDGQAIQLDGIDDFVDFGEPADWPAGLSPRSMCAWGMTSSVDAGFRWMMAYGSPATGQAMFIGMNGTGLYGGGYADDVITADFWTLQEWHHVALTYDGTTARLYADGVEVASGAKDWNLVPSRAHIGRQVNDVAEFWDGMIDEARLYDRVLSVEEIAWLAGRRTPMHKPF